MPDFSLSDWENAFNYGWKLYMASVARQAAAARAILSGGDVDAPNDRPIDHTVRRPGSGSTGPTECQILVQDLIEEGKAFRGGVPVAVRSAWLREIEPCKGKIPDSEYAKALQILHAKG
jgi:hypothetical protein